jgi:hypothetical protein
MTKQMFALTAPASNRLFGNNVVARTVALFRRAATANPPVWCGRQCKPSLDAEVDALRGRVRMAADSVAPVWCGRR